MLSSSVPQPPSFMEYPGQDIAAGPGGVGGGGGIWGPDQPRPAHTPIHITKTFLKETMKYPKLETNLWYANFPPPPPPTVCH